VCQPHYRRELNGLLNKAAKLLVYTGTDAHNDRAVSSKRAVYTIVSTYKYLRKCNTLDYELFKRTVLVNSVF